VSKGASSFVGAEKAWAGRVERSHLGKLPQSRSNRRRDKLKERRAIRKRKGDRAGQERPGRKGCKRWRKEKITNSGKSARSGGEVRILRWKHAPEACLLISGGEGSKHRLKNLRVRSGEQEAPNEPIIRLKKKEQRPPSNKSESESRATRPKKKKEKVPNRWRRKSCVEKKSVKRKTSS